MPNSILLHLNGSLHGEPIVEIGVAFARRWEARIRALALLDTRHLLELASTCESAAHASGELLRLKRLQQHQEVVHGKLQQVCQQAGLSYDVRVLEGDPLQLLPSESQFHDLVVTFFPTAAAQPPTDVAQELTPGDMVALLHQGVQPLLIVRKPEQLLRRVLLAYDGTAAAGKAIRQFLEQRLLPHAEYRLMAVGANAAKAREFLKEMDAYCRLARLEMETGYLCGTLRRALPAYAERWDADLVAIGVQRGYWRLPRLQKNPLAQLLLKTNCAVYAMS